MCLNIGFISLTLPASQWASSFCRLNTFFSFRRVFCHDNFDYWFFTICSDILFIYLWCWFSLIFHVSFSLPASSYLNPSTLYPGKVSKMCVSHQWFPFLWCQFLSLVYLVYFYLSDGSLVSSWYLISYLPLFLCQSFALLTLFNVSWCFCFELLKL